MLSKEFFTGRAGQFFVCYDLIRQGWNSFLADEGMPYDVLVDTGSKILKVQVRTTEKLVEEKRKIKRQSEPKLIYNYGLRNGKYGLKRMSEIDYVAFVALDIAQVAYFPVSEIQSRLHKGKIKTIMQFKSRRIKYVGRVYTNGTVRKPEWGTYFEDYTKFKYQIGNTIMS